jgi:hypothetical protein
MDARSVSQLVGFTFDEYKILGKEPLGRKKPRHPSLLRPIDVPEERIQQYLREFRRPKKRQAERTRRERKREVRKAAIVATSRAEAILKVLGSKFMTIAEIMRVLEGS